MLPYGRLSNIALRLSNRPQRQWLKTAPLALA
jgi:hypothetical protein